MTLLSIVALQIDNKLSQKQGMTQDRSNLSHDGLDPDYPVKFTEKDVQNKVDPQMNKAIDILTNEK